jgi:hypothetical protein
MVIRLDKSILVYSVDLEYMKREAQAPGWRIVQCIGGMKP